jgi:hypothetical protein
MTDTKGLTYITYVCNKYYMTQVPYTTTVGFCSYFNTHSTHITTRRYLAPLFHFRVINVF